MTPKELCVLIVKEPLVLIGLSSQEVIDIAQSYLALESRIQKLEAVAEAAKAISWQVSCIGEPEKTCDSCKFHEALEELEQK